MRIFQTKSFYNENWYKTILSIIIVLCCLLNLTAQKESNIKLKLETGLLWNLTTTQKDFSPYLSPFLYVEPKVKTSKNTDIGLRIGIAENPERTQLSDPNRYYLNNKNGTSILLIVPSFDYQFGKNNVHPFLGLGVGYYFLTTSNDIFATGSSSALLDVDVKNQIGFLLRGGLSWRKFMLGLELNYIPKADIEIPNGQIIGTIDYSNIALTIAYIIGVGRPKN